MFLNPHAALQLRSPGSMPMRMAPTPPWRSLPCAARPTCTRISPRCAAKVPQGSTDTSHSHTWGPALGALCLPGLSLRISDGSNARGSFVTYITHVGKKYCCLKPIFKKRSKSTQEKQFPENRPARGEQKGAARPVHAGSGHLWLRQTCRYLPAPLASCGEVTVGEWPLVRQQAGRQRHSPAFRYETITENGRKEAGQEVTGRERR